MVLRIHVRVPIRPTEDVDKVRGCIEKLFHGATLDVTETQVTARAPDLSRVRELIRNQRIPDTARTAMLSGLAADGLRSTFLLGKQAAAVGRVHFGTLRSPLGEVEVTLLGDEPHEVERAIYHTAPDTTVDRELSEVPHSERPEVVE